MADKDEWSEKYLKAINVIYGVISNEQLLFIKDKERAYKRFIKLDEKYLKESNCTQIRVRNKLERQG